MQAIKQRALGGAPKGTNYSDSVCLVICLKKKMPGRGEKFLLRLAREVSPAPASLFCNPGLAGGGGKGLAALLVSLQTWPGAQQPWSPNAGLVPEDSSLD